MEPAIAWVSLLAMIVIVGGFYFLFPRISRRGLLFGVYVGEEASQGAASRQITQSWYRGMALWFAASLAISLSTGMIFHSPAGSIFALLFLSFGFLVQYLLAYRRARSLAPEPAPTTSAAFIEAGRSEPQLLPWLAIAVGIAGGLYALNEAWIHYPGLPEMIPTHFGFSGRPDAWRHRSVTGVMMLPLLSLVMGIGLGMIALLTGRAKRAVRAGDQGISFHAQQRFRRVMSNFLATTSLLVTAMLTVLSHSSLQVALHEEDALSPVMMALTLVLLVFALGGSIYIALAYGQGGSRLEKKSAGAPLTNGIADNSCWVLGVFYVNREDPSIFVEKRFGLGYTINFGNPKAVILMIGFLGLVLAISLTGAFTK
jgi:uncharacterized membrane protein